MEKPLLPDTDRPYGLPDPGSMGKPLGKGEAEQGAETPAAAGGLETGTAKGIHC